MMMMLVFAQKAGAGLFFHNLLHTNAEKNSAKGQGDNSVSYNCTCLDDFLMPFDDHQQVLVSPPLTSFITTVSFFKADIPFRSTGRSSLRGPPAFTC